MDLNELSNKDLWHIICALTSHANMYHMGEREKIAGFLLAAYAEREGYEVTKEDLEDFRKEYEFGKDDVDFSNVL